MGTDWRLPRRPLLRLNDDTFATLGDRVGLDPDDADDQRRMAQMRVEINRALDAYPSQEIWMDRARPANRLEGLRRFKEALAELDGVWRGLDDRTWRDVDDAYAPGTADDREGGAIAQEIRRMAAAAASAEESATLETQGRDSRHPPTTDARTELVRELAMIFERYAELESATDGSTGLVDFHVVDDERPPTQAQAIADQRKALTAFVRTILEAAGVACPKDDANLWKLILDARTPPSS